MLLKNDATSLRLAWRLCDTFLGEDAVSAGDVAALAAGLRDHDLDIAWGVATMLRSAAFFAEANLGRRVLSPVEYVVGAVRVLELDDPPPATVALAAEIALMGQDLFYPPNVGGWAGGRGWLEPRALVRRAISPRPWSRHAFRVAISHFLPRSWPPVTGEMNATVPLNSSRMCCQESADNRSRAAQRQQRPQPCSRRRRLNRFDRIFFLTDEALMISRRDLLCRSSMISLAPLVPGFVARTVGAAEPDRHGRILVVIQLDGGNDGINTVVPYKDEGYPKNRRELRLDSRELIKLDGQAGIGLNPAMKPWDKLFEDGHLAVVHGVGYPNPSRSHFESMAIWQSAQSDSLKRDGYGWLGRGLDAAGRLPTGAPAAILLTRSELPLAIRGRRATATAMTQPEDFTLDRDAYPRGDAGDIAIGPLASFIKRERSTPMLSRTNSRYLCTAGSGVNYPRTSLAERLSMVARLIAPGSAAGFTTRSSPVTTPTACRPDSMPTCLPSWRARFGRFTTNCGCAGLDNRVAVLCFSEFGRRVEENGSSGTDHGTAGPVFLVGSRVQGGLVGTPPSLVDLDAEGDLKMTVDFRRVYASVLEHWLGISLRPILGESYAPLSVFRA